MIKPLPIISTLFEVVKNTDLSLSSNYLNVCLDHMSVRSRITDRKSFHLHYIYFKYLNRFILHQ